MPTSGTNGYEEIGRDARQRLTPTLPADAAPLLKLNRTANSGFGAFASRSIEANTSLLESNGPAVYVIYRAFRKEVCAWCFRYEVGRTWKIRFASEDGSGVAGIVFCSEGCRDAWKNEYGSVAVDAFAAVESLMLKQASNKGWAIELYRDSDDSAPSEEEIEEAWTIAEEQASLIQTFRLETSCAKPPESPKCPSRAQKHALAKAAASPICDTDALFFLLSGVLCVSSTRHSSQWRTLLSLNPSLHAVYFNRSNLQQVTSIFLYLTTVLPVCLIPYVIRETFEAILARDIGNSFGIWSTSPSEQPDSTTKPAGAQDEGAEMLGYGIWPIASFFNHSCFPNVSRYRVGRRWVFFSTRVVSEDEELCISYLRGEENTLRLEERRMRLGDAWGFTCQCAKCFHEEANETTG